MSTCSLTGSGVADFPAAVDEVVAGYVAAGFAVEIEHRTETFARLYLTDPDDPGEQHRVELVASWRLQPPVRMDVGPVLHPDDVLAGKMDALYNRAAARDFLDIDAAIAGGHYTLERLCQLAEAVDAGFDRAMFGRMLRYVERFDPADFAEYGVGGGPCSRNARAGAFSHSASGPSPGTLRAGDGCCSRALVGSPRICGLAGCVGACLRKGAARVPGLGAGRSASGMGRGRRDAERAYPRPSRHGERSTCRCPSPCGIA